MRILYTYIHSYTFIIVDHLYNFSMWSILNGPGITPSRSLDNAEATPPNRSKHQRTSALGACGQTLSTDRGCCVCQVAFLGRLRRSWLHPKSGFSRKVIHMRIRGCMVNEPLLNIPEHSFLSLSLWFADKEGRELCELLWESMCSALFQSRNLSHTIDIKWHWLTHLTHWNHMKSLPVGAVGAVALAQPRWPAMFQASGTSWLEGRGGVTVVTVTSCGQSWLVETNSPIVFYSFYPYSMVNQSFQTL